MDGTYRYYIGVDWGNDFHQACVVDNEGKLVAERKVKHTGEDLNRFLDYLGELCENRPEELAIAIEVPRGPVVESLVEREFATYAINPKQLDRFRDRYSTSGAKDDRRDAFVLGDSLRTDLNKFNRVRLDDPVIIALRTYTRAHEELVEERIRLSNRIREELYRYYPQMLKISSTMEEDWVNTLFAWAPTPESAQGLEATRVQQLLTEHGIRKLSGKDVVQILHETALKVAPGSAQAASSHILMLLERMKLVQSQVKSCEKKTKELLETLKVNNPTGGGPSGGTSDVEIIDSLPGAGPGTVAILLAEGAQMIAARDEDALRTQTGVAPVTKASGKRSGKKATVIMRRACNIRLKNALYHFAANSIRTSPWARERYDALRKKGHSHGRALRGLGDRWLSVLCAMLRSLTLYDPQHNLGGTKQAIGA